MDVNAVPDAELEGDTPRRRRSGGRSKKRSEASSGIEQPPFTRVRRNFEATKVVSDDELESIHVTMYSNPYGQVSTRLRNLNSFMTCP